MAMNEIALFKGVRIQPYQKYIDFMFAGVLAFIFLVYHLLYLLIGTAIIFVICKLIAQFLIRFKTKDLAEMIETQGFHNRTVIKKTTEYIPIDYKQTEYDYYPTMFYKRGKKTFVIHIKKDGSRFQDNYLELETIIEPML